MGTHGCEYKKNFTLAPWRLTFTILTRSQMYCVDPSLASQALPLCPYCRAVNSPREDDADAISSTWICLIDTRRVTRIRTAGRIERNEAYSFSYDRDCIELYPLRLFSSYCVTVLGIDAIDALLNLGSTWLWTSTTSLGSASNGLSKVFPPYSTLLNGIVQYALSFSIPLCASLVVLRWYVLSQSAHYPRGFSSSAH